MHRTPTSSPDQAERLVANCVCELDTIQAHYSLQHIDAIGFNSLPGKQIVNRCINNPDSDPTGGPAARAPTTDSRQRGTAGLLTCGNLAAYGAYSIRGNTTCTAARRVAIDVSFCQGGEACHAHGGYTCTFTGSTYGSRTIDCTAAAGRRVSFNYH